MKKNVVQIALIGLAVGSSLCGCSNPKSPDQEQQQPGGDSSCSGPSGCGQKTSGKEKNGANETSSQSTEMQQKRDAAAKEM